jgi:hypothetical protein
MRSRVTSLVVISVIATIEFSSAGRGYGETRAAQEPAAALLAVLRKAVESKQWSGAAVAAQISSQGLVEYDVYVGKRRPTTVPVERLAREIECLTARATEARPI